MNRKTKLCLGIIRKTKRRLMALFLASIMLFSTAAQAIAVSGNNYYAPSDYTNEYDDHMVQDMPSDYEYEEDEHDEDEYEEDEYEEGMYDEPEYDGQPQENYYPPDIPVKPDFDTSLFVPAAGGNIRVDFNPNGGELQDELHRHRYIELIAGQTGGSLGNNMPDPPENLQGQRFLGWNRVQNIPVGTDGTPFHSWTHVSLHESPLTVYARWGHQILFQCFHGTVSTQTRLVHTGWSVTEMPNTAWPSSPSNASRPGYRFVGWYEMIGPVWGEEFTADSAITRELVLVARWEESLPLTVTFNFPGSELVAGHRATRYAWEGTAVSATANNAIVPGILGRTQPPQITLPRPGVTLEGWWTESGAWEAGGTRWRGPMQQLDSPVVTQDIDVYANWVVRVWFDNNGAGAWWNGDGNGLLTSSSSLPWCSVTHTTRPNNTNTWRNLPPEGGTIAEHGTRFSSGASSWVWDPGTGTHIEIPGVTEPLPFRGAPANDPNRGTHATFLGWYDVRVPDNFDAPPFAPEIDLGGGVIARLFDPTTFIDSTKTYYARWATENVPTPTPSPTITVTFDANGGDFPDATSAPTHIWEVSDIHINNHIGTGPRAPMQPERQGHVFMGWFDNPFGAGTRFTLSASVGTIDRTLYAHWLPYMLVRFHANGTPESPAAPAAFVERRVPVGVTFSQMDTLWGLSLGHDAGWSSGNSGRLAAPYNDNWYRFLAIHNLFSRPGFRLMHAGSGQAPNDWSGSGSGDIRGWNTSPNGSGSMFLFNTPVVSPGGGVLKLYAQ